MNYKNIFSMYYAQDSKDKREIYQTRNVERKLLHYN